MPVSGAQQAWKHEMLQAAVHSMYSRLGSGRHVEVALRRRLRPVASGSFSGQSPQNAEPPPIQIARAAPSRSGPCQIVGERRRPHVAQHALGVRIRAAADDAAVAEHDGDRPGPGAGEAGREVVQRHGMVNHVSGHSSGQFKEHRAIPESSLNSQLETGH